MNQFRTSLLLALLCLTAGCLPNGIQTEHWVYIVNTSEKDVEVEVALKVISRDSPVSGIPVAPGEMGETVLTVLHEGTGRRGRRLSFPEDYYLRITDTATGETTDYEDIVPQNEKADKDSLLIVVTDEAPLVFFVTGGWW